MTRLAVLCALLLTICITGSSAFIRHSQAGLGCADRAVCATAGAVAAAVQGAAPVAEPAPAVRAARLLHRVSAMVVGLLAGAIALVGWSGLRGSGRGAAALALLVTGALAWLGRYTPHDLPLVTLGNVLGGFLLAAAFAWILAPAWRAPVSLSAPHSRGLLATALLLAFVQAVLGVMVSVRQAVDACPALVCWPGGAIDWRVFDPLLAGASGSPPAARVLHLAHRASGLALLGVCAMALVRGRATMPRALWRALPALLVVQVTIGLSAALGLHALAAATAHNVIAAMLVAVLALLAGGAARR